MEIELRKGALRAGAVTHGGELVSFRDEEGTEYIWSGDPAYWSGRDPILFPIVGALKDGTVQTDRGPCHMARHGFARRMEFAPAEQGEDFVTFQLRDTPETLEQYPYPFRLRVTHRLTDRGFATAYEVTNTGDGPMPFCIGGHTAYRCPLYPGERFEDYSLVFDEREDAPSVAVRAGGLLGGTLEELYLMGTNKIALRHEIFDRADTLIFDGLRSNGVRLVNERTGRGVRVEFGQFPMLGIWTMPEKNAPYICIEPWQGCAACEDETGRFEDKPHAVVLAPGQSKTLAFTAEVL